MQKRLSFLFTAFVALVLLSGCDPDRNIDPQDPPIDSDPQVTLISPANGYALAHKGETVQIQFEIHDNELLTTWEAKERWISVTGVEYMAETQIPTQFSAISTNNSVRTINYTVPNTPSVQVYTTIEIIAYATDNKGKVAKGKFRINVIPNVGDPSLYEFTEYTGPDGDTIFSILTGRDYCYDLIGHTSGTNQTMPLPNMYLREASVGTTISWILTSPIQSGVDSILVTTNESRFNFDELTYETTWQAFVTSNRIGMKTDPLSAGDVVILKLPTLPHFAVLRIVETNAAPCGCMLFDYKYSHN